MAEKPLWRPSAARVAASRVTAFSAAVRERWQVTLPDYRALYRWSVAQPEQFWKSVWQFCGVIAETDGETVIENAHLMPGARFFPDARLNFAQNLLRRDDDSPAIIFRAEDRLDSTLSWAQLQQEVSRLQQALTAAGVVSGDRIAGYLPNCPAAVIAMLATASLGAVWSSCSPDFGVEGVVDRFGQIAPKILIAGDGYFYNGRQVSVLDRIAEIATRLPSLVRTVVLPYADPEPALTRIPLAISWQDFTRAFEPQAVRYLALPFDHPLYILYSSGTTGAPKCIVHGAGGTLLQHLKEHQLHTDFKPGDRVMYYTTCGWMMWNWLVSALASDCTLLLYDGSPLLHRGAVLFDFADATDMSCFGTSAKFLDALAKLGAAPGKTHNLTALRTLLSTGSPLAPETFDYVYREIKADLNLASISGGTDIVSCFALGSPVLPVRRGELQTRGLGMKVAVFGEAGRPMRGHPGELVCTAPFPSMPLGFWNDADGTRYHAAYFSRFPNVWCHGDWCALTRHDGLVIYGRSDAVLNPGGVRIGTAEIYRQVEQLDEVVESIVIGQQWPRDQPTDVRVVLFVQLSDGLVLDDALIERIKNCIRQNTTPRHVPDKIVQVADIPRTRSGKIVELAVRDIVEKRAVRNAEALANPEALDLYRDLPQLQ